MNLHRHGDSGLAADIAWASDRNGLRSRLGASLKRCWDLNIRDPLVTDLLHSQIQSLRKLEAAGKLPPFKAWPDRAGQVLLGRDFYGVPVWWMVEWFKLGTLIASNIGGGKTTLLAWIFMQLAMLGCCGWLFEGYKRFLRRLHRPLLAAGISSVILRPRHWRWNPLQCDCGDVRAHCDRIRDLLARRLDAGVRGGIYLGQALHALYSRFGNFEGRRNAFPTLIDVFEFLRAAPGLVTISRDALLDRLAALCVSCTPQAIAWRLGWRAADLARTNIVFECDGISLTATQIFQESLIFSVFQHEIERGVSNGKLSLIIGFEDSARLFDGGSQLSSAMTPLEEIAGLGRGEGIGLIPLTQSLLGFSKRTQSNLAGKILGRLGSAEDYRDLGADMGLTAEQEQWIPLHLDTGWFVGQAASGDHRESFLFHAPRLPALGPVSDEEADQTAAALRSLPTVFATEFEHWEPRSTVEVASPSPAANPVPPASKPVLADTELKVLLLILANPGKPMGFYARKSGLSGRRAAQIRERLIRAGLVRDHTLAAKGRGRPSIILEPLPAAFQAAGQPQPEAGP